MAKHVPHRDFVRAWQSSASVGAVCARLGMQPRAAMERARVLRRRGVKLHDMRAHGEDLPSLAKLAHDLTNERRY